MRLTREEVKEECASIEEQAANAYRLAARGMQATAIHQLDALHALTRAVLLLARVNSQDKPLP